MLLVAVAGVSLVTNAEATIIGIDFHASSTTDQSVSESAEVGPYKSAGWYNHVDPSAVPGPSILKDSTGADTTAMFGFTQGGNTLSGHPIYNSGYGWAGAANPNLTPDQQLYNGSAAAIPGTVWSQQVVLQNIPYGVYDVYLLVNAPRVAADTTYVRGSIQIFNGGVVGGAGTTIYFQDSNRVNAQIPPTLGYLEATGTTPETATIGANYVCFRGLTNPNQTFDFLNIAPADVPYSSNITLGAVEIVSAVPEPTSLGMLAIGGAALMVRRRRKPE
jgi:hypothetical protein